MSHFSKILLLSFFIFHFLFFISKAQINLVPNPSFESYTTCPYSFGQNYFITSWQSFRSSPDYYNSCASYSTGVSVPKNDAGYQQAYNGVGYVGVISFYSSSESEWEILGAQLINPLSIGVKYFFSMEVSLSSISPTWCNAASDHLGASFSTVQFSTVTPKPLSNSSKIYSNTIIQDTTSWVRILGSFVSDSNYSYIMIGNFYNTISTNTIALLTGQSIYSSYYFIDDIKLSTDSLYVNNVSSLEPSNEMELWPNPANEIINLVFKGEISLNIYNNIGQEVYNETIKGASEPYEINISKLSSGLYYFIVADKIKNIQKKYKIIKQ